MLLPEEAGIMQVQGISREGLIVMGLWPIMFKFNRLLLIILYLKIPDPCVPPLFKLEVQFQLTGCKDQASQSQNLIYKVIQNSILVRS